MKEIYYRTEDRQDGWIYVPSAAETSAGPFPLVVITAGSTGDARKNAAGCGWVRTAEQEDIILVAPNYDTYAVYSILNDILSSVRYAQSHFPVDETRRYAAGFSNGGGVSVALASEFPELFAGIAAYGWFEEMHHRKAGVSMPFLILQGTEEFIEITPSGAPAVTDDEQTGLRDLLLFDGLLDESTAADYGRFPYWGYGPHESETRTDDSGTWHIGRFYKEGFRAPFAELILLDGGTHRPRRDDARFTWPFFRRFSRGRDGILREHPDDPEPDRSEAGRP